MTGIGGVLVPILLFLAVMGSLVLVHELGHYVAAKRLKVRVLEFGIGFPPRAKVLRARGETLWTLNWLPIGGFVRLEGEDGSDRDDPRSFAAQGLPAQLVIVLAGVVMNIVVAFLIFTAVAWVATPLVGVSIPAIQPDSPAASAGIVAGDQILRIDGQGYDLYSDGIISGIRSHAGQTVTLTVRHADGTTTDLRATLRSQSQIDETHGALGISSTPDHPFEPVLFNEYAGHPLPEAIGIAGTELSRGAGLVLSGLADLVTSIATNPGTPPPAQGPIGIAATLGQVFTQAGIAGVLYLAGILSINLAVVNVLPFPPLDGGRMLVLVLKRVAGRRISLRAERLTYAIGFVILITFMIWISGFDVAGRGSP